MQKHEGKFSQVADITFKVFILGTVLHTVIYVAKLRPWNVSV